MEYIADTFYKPNQPVINDPIKSIQNLLDVQGQNGNWNYDEYQHGLYNGLMLALGCITTVENIDDCLRGPPKNGYLYPLQDSTPSAHADDDIPDQSFADFMHECATAWCQDHMFSVAPSNILIAVDIACNSVDVHELSDGTIYDGSTKLVKDCNILQSPNVPSQTCGTTPKFPIGTTVITNGNFVSHGTVCTVISNDNKGYPYLVKPLDPNHSYYESGLVTKEEELQIYEENQPDYKAG